MHEGQVKVERMSRGLHVLYSMYRTQVQHAEKLNPQLIVIYSKGLLDNKSLILPFLRQGQYNTFHRNRNMPQ